MPTWTRAWAGMAAALLLAVGVSGGAVFASSESLPDSPLYSIKRAAERARIALTPSEESRAQLHLQFADKRGKEIAAMAEKGNAREVDRLQQDFIRHIEMAFAEAGISMDDVFVTGPAMMAQASADAQLQAAAAPAPALSPAAGAQESARATTEGPVRQQPADKAQPQATRATPTPAAKAIRATAIAMSPEETKRQQEFLRTARAHCEKNVARITLALQNASPGVKAALTRLLDRACQHYALNQVPTDFAKRVLLIQGVAVRRGDSLVVGGRRIEIAAGTQIKRQPEAGHIVIVGGLLQEDGSILALNVETKEKASNRDQLNQIVVQGPLLLNAEDTYTVGGYSLLHSAEQTKVDEGFEHAQWVQVEGKIDNANEIKATEIKVLDNAPEPLDTPDPVNTVSDALDSVKD